MEYFDFHLTLKGQQQSTLIIFLGLEEGGGIATQAFSFTVQIAELSHMLRNNKLYPCDTSVQGPQRT